MAGIGANNNPRRVAIVGGLRTPFVKMATAYEGLAALDLAAPLVAEMIGRVGLDPESVDQVVFGQVVPTPAAPNIAREIVLRVGLPHRTEAFAVSRACATGTQALVSASKSILLGDANVAICGGADSLSRPPITYGDRFVDALLKANSARTAMAKAKAFSGVRIKDILPTPPAIREVSTGETMGECAEKMAKENGISREAQDAFSLRSHQRSAQAWESGVYADEVMTFRRAPKYEAAATTDAFIRADTNLEKLGRLRPVFDKKHGSVTAGNSSPLTDGAAALVLMEEATAKQLGFEPLAFVRSWAFAGLDPSWQLLMGPSFACPIALDRAQLSLEQIDLVDMHEAFAAQMLSNLQAFKSDAFAQTHLGRDKAMGEVPDEKLNIYGGSLSLGHPFAATGARQALTMANELTRRGGGTALITQCAAGGLGAAVVLER